MLSRRPRSWLSSPPRTLGLDRTLRISPGWSSRLNVDSNSSDLKSTRAASSTAAVVDIPERDRNRIAAENKEACFFFEEDHSSSWSPPVRRIGSWSGLLKVQRTGMSCDCQPIRSRGHLCYICTGGARVVNRRRGRPWRIYWRPGAWQPHDSRAPDLSVGGPGTGSEVWNRPGATDRLVHRDPRAIAIRIQVAATNAGTARGRPAGILWVSF